MAEERTYRTRQRELVSACLAEHARHYLTVDMVRVLLTAAGEKVGRSTVYRNLEAMAASGAALKAMAPGREASYRLAPEDGEPAGQLVCLDCGEVLPLDCHMVGEMASHVLHDHHFRIEPARTVLYGVCENCMAKGESHE